SISSRRIIPFNHAWLFTDKPTAMATTATFNDKGLTGVTIPHTNKMLPMNGFDEEEYMFVSIYRRHFRLPQELKNQRIFVDFGGVMTAAKVFINGKSLGEYRGGYTPFSSELTKDINWNGDNVLAVEVDSTERKDIPPFGNLVDYLTFGGIYRDVQLRAVPQTFIENVFARPVNVLEADRSLRARVYLEGAGAAKFALKVELRDGEKTVASKSQDIPAANGPFHEITLSNLGNVELWDVSSPRLYNVRVTLSSGSSILDHYETRIGFREGKFTPEGFYLNGKHLKLRGLDRHQTFPFVGQAMPARVQ